MSCSDCIYFSYACKCFGNEEVITCVCTKEYPIQNLTSFCACEYFKVDEERIEKLEEKVRYLEETLENEIDSYQHHICDLEYEEVK